MNVTFLRFEICDSGEECSSTDLKIAEFRRGDWQSRWYWSYCEYRRHGQKLYYQTEQYWKLTREIS